MPPRRATWVYLVSLACALAALNLAAIAFDLSHPDQVVEVLFLAVATAVMSIPDVRIDQGRLTLNGVISGASSIVLNPLNATIVSFTIALRQRRPRGLWPVMGNVLIFGTGTCIGSITAFVIAGSSERSLATRLAVIVVNTIANVGLAATALAVQENESPVAILRRNVTPSFVVAFGYFGLASLLISYVLDGSALGYLLATIVCILSLALTDSIAGRRIRSVLESELSDADRHLFHSRAVEGVVHNLRNHIATAHAYLKEIDPRKLDDVDRDNLATATSAADDAVTVLHSLAQGATPKVSYAPNPVDLNELASQAAGIARSRARAKEIQLSVRESATEVKVKADPLLIREVMTNLVNNAIDAAQHGGRVEIQTGHRNNGWPYVSVGDNGPGVADDNRHHLFEPHFTTKEGGTGLGLFMSYGIVREHQGDIVFSNNRPRGAVFTVVLPPFSG
jgi:signal transduction histidine kinase